MATGEQQEATAGAGRRRRSRHGTIRRRDDGRDLTTGEDTPEVACDEEHEANEGGSSKCQGKSREDQDPPEIRGTPKGAPYIDENDRQCKDQQGKDRQSQDHGHEAEDDEAGAKSRDGPEGRRWCSAATDDESSKELSSPHSGGAVV